MTGHVDNWEDVAIDYVDGTLDAATKAAVEAHLGTCAPCASRLGVQQAVCATLRHVPLVEPPADLEDQVIGEIAFPRRPAQTVRPVERRGWADIWQRRLRPWMPATVAVVIFFAALISFGVYHGTFHRGEAALSTTAGAAVTSGKYAPPEATAAAATTAAPATTAAQAAGLGAGSADNSATTAAASAATEAGPLAAAGPTTTVAASETTSAPATTTTLLTTFATMTPAGAPATDDAKTMIADLKSATGPLYFAFEPSASENSGGVDVVSLRQQLADQLTSLTGLQPVSRDLSLDGTTFAAYVPKNDAAAVVDLLQQIGASLRLTVSLSSQPVATHAAERGADYSAVLRQLGGKIPELNAITAPQPSVTKYAYSTSTVPTDAGGGVPPEWTAPDGTHVLIVIYLGE